MRRASIRFRITAMAVIAVVVVLVGISFALITAQNSQLTATLDTSLRQRADDIAALLASDTPEQFGAGQLEGFAQLVAAGGRVIAASPNLQATAALPITFSGGPEQIRTLADLPVDDDAFRVLSRSVSANGAPATLHVATSFDVVGESTEALTTSLAISIPIVVALLGSLVWWLVGRTLRPVEDIRAEVAAIGAFDLDRRVPMPGSEDEIASLASTMNLMLARIEESVEQQQRFVADASHELRSPLTRMRSELEVDLIEAGAAGHPRLESIRDEVIELQRLVEDLLHLARADSGKAVMADEAVDVDDIVLDEARQLQAVTGLTVEASQVSGAHVYGAARELRRAIRNLADNARRHAETTVTFTLREVAGVAELTVADDGPGVAERDSETIFERFGRTDDSRTRSSGGTGLGLSIAREIARRHGGNLVLAAGEGDGARFVMRLPLAEPPRGP